MLLNLTSEQEFFRDTTARFLDEQAPVEELRRLRDDPVGFDARYWQRGAELGWTTLLVGEEHGGGSISGRGLVDLSLVAHEFGRHAAPGPLSPANIVAAALSADPAGGHRDVLAGLVAGTSVASWCYGEPRPNDEVGQLALEIRDKGSELVVHGTKRPVEAAASATHLLVTGRTGAGLTQVLVPTDAPGISLQPLHAVDLTRRFSQVTFDGVRVPREALVGGVGAAADDAAHQLRLALVMAAAESVGAMQTALDMTIQWAFDRYSFGRPLASYQELKHRFADMKSWLEAGHAIADAAAEAVASGAPDAAELAGAAKAFIGQYGSELIQDCVQIHGGIGLTFDHDLHLYLRRHTMDRTLYGTPADHRRLIADSFHRGLGAA